MLSGIRHRYAPNHISKLGFASCCPANGPSRGAIAFAAWQTPNAAQELTLLRSKPHFQRWICLMLPGKWPIPRSNCRCRVANAECGAGIDFATRQTAFPTLGLPYAARQMAHPTQQLPLPRGKRRMRRRN
jgi:hypothetical protein